jgi:acyl-CoA synthetase (NDP forming)
MKINFKNIDKIFERAEKAGRNFLLEHEVYRMLREAGLRTPKFVFVAKGKKIGREDLAGLKSSELVLKVVSPRILHKTDVGGVVFVKNSPAAVNAGCRRMLATVPGKFQAWAGKFEKKGSVRALSQSAVVEAIRGILVLEKVQYEKFGFGSELLLGIRNSREFGPILTMGAGGVEVEYLNERIQEGKAASIGSAHLLQRKDILPHLEPLAVYDKLARPFRGKAPVLTLPELRDTYFRFLELAAHYSPFKRANRFVIEEAEVNPFVIRAGKLIPLDGLCRFSRSPVSIQDRPIAAIGHLLQPRSIAVIGVSERMNLGHIILNNILRQGFLREKVYVVKPGVSEIEGCRCVPGVAELPVTVDLFVLTLAAEQSYEVMADLIKHGKARSVIIIAGGLGEKTGSQGLEEKIVGLIAESRKKGKLTPAVNGGNCLGIYSKPGRYDTTFIPEYKLKWPKNPPSNLVYISQSGAFMVSRISKLQRFEPLYAISLGNQIDLRVSDYLHYLEDEDEAKVFAVYVEGFKPGDGYALAVAASGILRKKGRSIVLYKSGRTPEGRLATSSHTASVAGDYNVCRAVLEQAGVIVADSLFEFESFIKGLMGLAGKNISGNRIGLISNAGFENVIMADSIKNRERLELALFTDATKERLSRILGPLGIDRLQDIKNPLDITPMADDEVFVESARAMLEDPNVDCAVISPVPMTMAMQTLPPGDGYVESIYNPESTSSRLIELFRTTEKPFVVNVDAGADYDPMAAHLEQAGIPTFRRSDEAVKFLRKYIGAGLKIQRLYRR